MDSQYIVDSMVSKPVSPARLKFNKLSSERSVSPEHQASLKVQADCIRNASKFQLLTMPKELKQKGLRNLELLTMDEWQKNLKLLQTLRDKHPKLIKGLNSGDQ